jgi:3D-(3,5/4)-trihydroxycyclohexane-1,2-dione acylhydrolase (decyclizing)
VTTVIEIETDPSVAGPDSRSWWDVPVAQVTQQPSTREALERYEAERHVQRDFLRPTTLPASQ